MNIAATGQSVRVVIGTSWLRISADPPWDIGTTSPKRATKLLCQLAPKNPNPGEKSGLAERPGSQHRVLRT